MNTKTQLILAWSIPILIILGIVGYAIYAVQASQSRLGRLRNLRLIEIAISTSFSARNKFPDVVEFDENGKPKHSWRARIAEYLEAKNVYDFNESWNAPVNKSAIGKMPIHFSSNWDPDHEGITNYFAVTGPGTVWEVKTEDERNSNYKGSVVIIEIPDSKVPWTEPRDFTFEEFVAWWKANGAKYSKNPPWVMTHMHNFQKLTDDVMKEIIARHDEILAREKRATTPH